MLFIIATPIGNLQDITYRAIETLKQVDLILCEDTRKSQILLNHYEIKKPLKSFHKFNERQQEAWIIDQLKDEKQIALLSDAGMPTICDPGQGLVHLCREQELPVTVLPGPSAPLLALALSGLPNEKFQFCSFLPKKGGERKSALLDALFYPGLTLFFESPGRIKATLQQLEELGPRHKIALCRELTKVHEECLVGYPKDLLNARMQGEMVLIVEGRAKLSSDDLKGQIEEAQKLYGLSKQEAVKLIAQLHQIPKNQVYKSSYED